MKFINKDITTVTKGIVAHGCNAKGVMGSGVAKAIRSKWPSAYEAYREIHPRLRVGDVIPAYISEDLLILNCITQETYGRDPLKVYASLTAIVRTMNLAAMYSIEKALPIYIPRIGCGLGGLNWERDVEPELKKIEEGYGVEFIVCDYA